VADARDNGAEMPLSFRAVGDLVEIVRLLADDPLGATRERYETPLPVSYARAFRAIENDPNNELVVAGQDARVVGVHPRYVKRAKSP